MKHLFIVNPVAGGKDKTDYVSAKVAQCFSLRDEEFEIYTTKAPMDACEKIREEAEKCESLRVYACGGDGTLNECVCGAAGHDNVSVACFPVGTGNDFVRAFGEEGSRFSELSELVDGETRSIDLMKCNERFGINITCIGIDARIGVDVHKYSSLPVVGGAMGYVVSLGVNFFKGIKNEMRIVCNGKLYYGETSLVAACNGRYYGGGFNPVPEARLDDGIMDILIVKGVSRPTLLRLVGNYAKGKYKDYPKYITHVQSTSLEIESDEELVVAVDGEELRSKHISISLIHSGINFVFPKGLSMFAEEKAAVEA